MASVRRQNSTASAGSHSLTLQQRAKAKGSQSAATPVLPTSAHVSDPFLQDFLQPGFDPAAYWNATLGAGATSSRGRGPPATTTTTTTTTTTSDQAAAAQTCLSQLAAHTTRLTAVLSQLTDDILRSGSRMAYEVELLRGETIGLADVLEAVGQEFAIDGGGSPAGEEDGAGPAAADGDRNESRDPSAPPALAQLRMLAQVRSRLDTVIRTFGDAMEFVMPPSAMSVSASFLSVSGPETSTVGQDGGRSAGERAGSTVSTTTTSLEEKGQQVLKMRRDEVVRMLEAGSSGSDSSDGGKKGLEEAAARVAALRALCQVWAGTAEEKARVRFVDGLQRMVGDRQKQLERERLAEEQAAAVAAAAAAAAAAATAAAPSSGGGGSSTGGTAKGDSATAASTSQESNTRSSSPAAAAINRGYASGYGFISQLQKIRGGLQ